MAGAAVAFTSSTGFAGATGALKKAEYVAPNLCKMFYRGGSAKIALRCPNEKTLFDIQAKERELKLI